LINKKKIQHLF